MYEIKSTDRDTGEVSHRSSITNIKKARVMCNNMARAFYKSGRRNHMITISKDDEVVHAWLVTNIGASKLK